jgi:uncharacterized cupin superfamily protein
LWHLVMTMTAAAWHHPAGAADFTWNATSGNWEDSANWNPAGGVPGPADSALINAGTVSLGSSRGLASLALWGGTLEGTGALRITGPSSWTSGTFAGAGTHTFEAALQITGPGRKTLGGGRTLALAGATTWGGNASQNANEIQFLTGTLANTGAFIDANEFSTRAFNGDGGASNFDNAGNYVKTGAGTTTVGVAFNNTGTTTVQAGTLWLAGGGTSSGRFVIGHGAAISFNDGIHTLNNAVTGGAGTLEIGPRSEARVNINGGTYASALAISGGTLQGSGATFKGSATWSAGAIDGSGTHVFEGSMQITGAGRKTLGGGRTVALAGATTWGGNASQNANEIQFLTGTLVNTGTFTDANVFSTRAFNGDGGVSTFNNDGTYVKTGAGTTTVGVAFNNTGTTTVQAGTLWLAGGGTGSGRFAIGQGAVISFNDGTHTLNNAVTSGAGTLEIGPRSEARVNINGGTHTSALAISGGTLQGSGATFKGSSTWSAGAIDGAGTHVFEGSMQITGAGRKTLGGGRTVALSGATTWGGNASHNENEIQFLTATLANTGTFTDANTFSTQAFNGDGGVSAFNNDGSYVKTGAGTTTFRVLFNNRGSLMVQNGTLVLGAASNSQSAADGLQRTGKPQERVTDGAQSAAALIDVAAGAELQISSTFDHTGVLQGDGTVRITAAEPLLNRGVLAAGTLGTAGHLTLSGSLALESGGSLAIDLMDTTRFDRLTVSEDVSLQGTMAISALPGFAPHVGDSFRVLEFAGQQLAGTGFGTIDWQGPQTIAFAVEYNAHDVTLRVSAVPEPASGALMLGGLAMFAAATAKRRSPGPG